MALDEREERLRGAPFGARLVAISVQNAYFFPGTRDYISTAPDTPTERIKTDKYAIVYYHNLDTGGISGLGTLVELEKVAEDGDSIELHCYSLARVEILNHHAVSDLVEFDWRVVEEKTISESLWAGKIVKRDIKTLRAILEEVLKVLPDIFEERTFTTLLDEGTKEDLRIRQEKKIQNLVRAINALSKPVRETFGSTLDWVAFAIFDVCYFLSRANPGKTAMRLASNMFHSFAVEERLRRVLKFADWFNYNLYQIADGDPDEEPEEKDTDPVHVHAGSENKTPQAQALFARYQEVKPHMPPDAKSEFEREFSRFAQRPESDSALGLRLERIVALPWDKRSQPPDGLQEVKRALDEDHFGLAKIKERILEYVAVRMLNAKNQGKALCFVGPKGVGKTSLGRSIARALGKRFVSLSLGGMDDVSDLRGHHYTYRDAAPGFIIQLIQRANQRDCVFVLDEIDKLMKNWRGNPAAALLEILDPEQNDRFMDHYLGIPFDLSEILFIATANITETINPILLDRLEIIEIPGYTDLEKLEIAKRHLIPRRRKANGFPIRILGGPTLDCRFTDEAILELTRHYALEAGVRDLERELDRPFRKMARAVVEQDPSVNGVVEITPENLERYCGKSKFKESFIPEVLPVGTTPVLAVSESGGFLYMLEVTIGRHPGRRKIAMKGVRESGENKDAVNQVAESLEKAVDGLTAQGKILFEALKELEEAWGCPSIIEGNITNGSIPKDGPSAGLATFVAVYGALRQRSIKLHREIPLIAFTGEIETNLDTVGKVGGIRDKVLAAWRHGVKRLFIPKANEADLEDVPPEVRSRMEIIPTTSRWQALMIAYPEDRGFIEEYLRTTGTRNGSLFYSFV